ncbi:MAG: CoA-binding protein [Candidatus Nanopelagicales bacterium]
MSFSNPDDISFLLNETKVWAIVGLGTDESRPAFMVAKFLKEKGKSLIAIHPRAISVLDAPAYATLHDAQKEYAIDVVDCFVNSSRVGEIIDEAILLGLPSIWTQLDVTDDRAAKRAEEAGMRVVMNRCPAIEWSTYV